MKISMAFLRVFFVILSLIFLTAFMVTLPIGPAWQKLAIGLGLGVLFSSFLFSLEILFKRYKLKAFNTVAIGLIFGYIMGQALSLVGNALLDISHMRMVLQPQTLDLIEACLFLIGTYLGTTLTIHYSDEIQFSIPFLRLRPSLERKKDLIIDSSALADSRILDLATTGLVDHTLILSRTLLNQLQTQSELGNEMDKTKAKQALESLKKLRDIPELGLRVEETKLTNTGETHSQLLQLARLLDANILTADVSQVKIPPVEGIKIINLHALSNALKPLMETGESLKIKIQRYGKEPNQGVGYLEDGTMVVVNGGGDYIGETIDVNVLSVKHTTSGRMIFCNTLEDMPAKGNHIHA